jgi:hypothetical protein
MKKLLGITALLAALFSNAVYFGGPDKTPAQKLKDEQASYRAAHGKYTNAPKNLPAECKADEYVAPAGPGYQITCIEAGGTRSYGEGPEAEARSYFIPNATTTP